MAEGRIACRGHARQWQAKLGKVFAASGLRENPKGMLLDWAIIEILPNRSGVVNCIPGKRDVPTTYRHFYSPASSIIMDTEQPRPGMKVFKIGRRTGFTGGRIKGIEGTDLKFWVQKPDGTWCKKTSKAFLVVSEGGRVFGDPGDSGSFVFNEFGMLVGLCVGGDDQLGTGVFTGAEDLFANINL